MLIRFDGRTAIVAGAARGIGQTIARSLAGDGARVIACDLLVDALVPIAGRVDGGGEIIAARVDVTDEASIAEVVGTAGGADILVYVAAACAAKGPGRWKMSARTISTPSSMPTSRARSCLSRLSRPA
jgi:3-oxoacyl-[acyl-carrier protein] reductase